MQICRHALQFGLGSGEVPQALDEGIGQGVEIDVKLAICHPMLALLLVSHVPRPLTLNIVLSVCVIGLVVVDHGNHMKEVVLVELLQSVRQLLHVDLGVLH